MNYLLNDINDISDNEINIFTNSINNLKKERVNKILDNKKKKQSIVGELLLSKLLKTIYNANYNNIDFYYNKHGKPYFKNINNLFFNISHSKDMVICVLSDDEIGVDIEKIRITNINCINFFATENEKKYILEDDVDIYKRLFKIWCLKEAYFKMLGTNILNMKNVEFVIDGKHIFCSDKNVDILLKEYNSYIFAIIKKKKV